MRSITDSQTPALFAIGVLDTDSTQHAALIAETTKIIYIPPGQFDVELVNAGAAAQQQVTMLENFLGFHLSTLTIENIVWIMVGHAVAKGVDDLSDLV